MTSYSFLKGKNGTAVWQTGSHTFVSFACRAIPSSFVGFESGKRAREIGRSISKIARLFADSDLAGFSHRQASQGNTNSSYSIVTFLIVSSGATYRIECLLLHILDPLSQSSSLMMPFCVRCNVETWQEHCTSLSYFVPRSI